MKRPRKLEFRDMVTDPGEIFPADKCRDCGNRVRRGITGTGMVNGKRVHLTFWGCGLAVCWKDNQQIAIPDVKKPKPRKWLRDIRVVKEENIYKPIPKLAKILGCTAVEYSNIENGRTVNPDPELLKKIADYWGFDVSRFEED